MAGLGLGGLCCSRREEIQSLCFPAFFLLFVFVNANECCLFTGSPRVPEPTRQRSHKTRTSRAGSRASQPPANGRPHAPLLPPMSDGPSPQILVDAIFSAHSDGLMVILRRSDS